MNIVLLQGVLSSQPRERTLPSGSLLVNWEVTTTNTDGTKESVPVSWFDPPKSLQSVSAGDNVIVLGSIQRRFYRTGGGTASSTQVVAERGARSSRATLVDRICLEALDRVEPAA